MHAKHMTIISLKQKTRAMRDEKHAYLCPPIKIVIDEEIASLTALLHVRAIAKMNTIKKNLYYSHTK